MYKRQTLRPKYQEELKANKKIIDQYKKDRKSIPKDDYDIAVSTNKKLKSRRTDLKELAQLLSADSVLEKYPNENCWLKVKSVGKKGSWLYHEGTEGATVAGPAYLGDSARYVGGRSVTYYYYFPGLTNVKAGQYKAGQNLLVVGDLSEDRVKELGQTKKEGIKYKQAVFNTVNPKSILKIIRK